jgi:Flp pilus assembly protein TadD
MLLEELVRRDRSDVEAHLLLASVYRRVRRIDLSRRQLCQLQDCPGAAKWRFEIGRELAAIEEPTAVGA